MKEKPNCLACKQLFDKDSRTVSRQTFCSRAECQRERRRRSQKLRRLRQGRSEDRLSSRGINFNRLQCEMKPIEAKSTLEDPFVQGLISMLIGTNDLDEVKNAIRRLIKHGQKL